MHRSQSLGTRVELYVNDAGVLSDDASTAPSIAPVGEVPKTLYLQLIGNDAMAVAIDNVIVTTGP